MSFKHFAGFEGLRQEGEDVKNHNQKRVVLQKHEAGSTWQRRQYGIAKMRRNGTTMELCCKDKDEKSDTKTEKLSKP